MMDLDNLINFPMTVKNEINNKMHTFEKIIIVIVSVAHFNCKSYKLLFYKFKNKIINCLFIFSLQFHFRRQVNVDARRQLN